MLGVPHAFQAKGRGGNKHPSDVSDRAAHAQALLQALDTLANIPAENLPGLYLEVTSRPNEKLKKNSLDTREIALLKCETTSEAEASRETATLFATAKGIDQLRKKVTEFETEDTPLREKDGQIIPGRPRNADLVQSLAVITEAGLRALWRSPAPKFPADDAVVVWEIWLDPAMVGNFVQQSAFFDVAISAERLEFPEDVVVIGYATRDALAMAVRRIGGVRALAAPTVTADFFDSLDVHEQTEWVESMQGRCTYATAEYAGYVTLLDTGVSRAHPLIQPALAVEDRHAANPGWGLDDVKGHGTQLAGLSLFGDLTIPLQETGPLTVGNRLESVKLLPDAGANPHFLLGAVTRNAVDAVEAVGSRRRTFTMASTTGEDTPHDGAPTSWSSEVDQLASGVSGLTENKRLILISAGNTIDCTPNTGNYLDMCEHSDNEIQSPAQAWNAVCVGAYTEKTQLPDDEEHPALAPFGDLSPASRTASWSSHWALKPDVVLEGGNWINGPPPPMQHGWLSLLTTHHNYPTRSFCFSHDTSGSQGHHRIVERLSYAMAGDHSRTLCFVSPMDATDVLSPSGHTAKGRLCTHFLQIRLWRARATTREAQRNQCPHTCRRRRDRTIQPV